MKKILIYIILSASVFCVSAQNIEQVFINFPDLYIPLLSKEKRAELLFNHNVAKTDTIVNNFKGTSKLLILDTENNFLKLELTEKSKFEMKIWTLNDTVRFVGFSHTVCAPVCDSRVAFFNMNFKRLDTDKNQMFPDIAIQDFLNKEKIAADGKNLENMVKKHDALFATITFQPNSDNILLKSHAKEFLSAEVYADIEPYLIGNFIELIFENGIFKKGVATWK